LSVRASKVRFDSGEATMSGQDVSGDDKPSLTHICAYIGALARDLRLMARGNDLILIASLLNLVEAEAERQVKEELPSPGE
jgi:hypothetical protein